MSVLVALVVVLGVLVWPPRREPVSASQGVRALPGGRTRREGMTVADAAALAELLAMALRSGGSRARAVEVVAPDAPSSVRPLLDELASALAAGASGSQAWRRWADAHPALEPCAAAWRLSDRCGVPLAPALEQAASSARSRLATAQRVEAASAGARATMTLLTVLPGLGLVAGWALGVSPMRVAHESPVAAGSVLVGAVLTVVGWTLGRAILRRAVRPGLA